ncbi:MAG: hypothetical protein HDT01_05540, partial [Bacteroidales bacterium]|nr:hypothetical protein [Bacteroidales bacterium]
MKDIECPNCHTTFQVDESTYESIVAQVRNKVFNEELANRMREADEQFKAREESIRLKAEKDYEQRLATAGNEQSKLLTEITRLEGIISGYEASKKSALAELKAQSTKEMFDALAAKDKRIAELEAENSNKDSRHRIQLLEQKNLGDAELQSKIQLITELQAEIRSSKLAAANHEAELKE